jgi:hypothetical protein
MGHNWLDNTPSEEAKWRLSKLIVEVNKKEMTVERDVMVKATTRTAMRK